MANPVGVGLACIGQGSRYPRLYALSMHAVLHGVYEKVAPIPVIRKIETRDL